MNTKPTESYARGRTDVPLIEQTIGDFFDDMAARQPDALALVSRHEGRRSSYRELQAQANRLASALLRSGLASGDRVGIWSHNNVAWVLMQIATAKAGLILVNINPAYRTAEVEYALNKVGCKALVTMPRFKTSEYLALLRELGAAHLPSLQNVWWIDSPEDADEVGLDIPLARFSALLAAGDAQDARVAQVQRLLHATDPINIQFTSGTTGFPKGATLTHRNIL
ncbi:MAG: AMP-binding protein, partial [Burkholderiaceae bacterium]|nr:AMP-binding protein [Burkholderiaceae bacterium]